MPVGMYQPELVLPTELQGGEKYAWKPFGPTPPKLPPIIVKNEHLFDGIYSVGCGYGGKQHVQISGFEEYQLSPCFSQLPKVQDGISVSPSSVEFPCGSQQTQTTVIVYYAGSKFTYHNPVTLSVDPTSLPAGMTASFSPNPTNTQSTLTLSINGVVPGSYQLIIQDDRGKTVILTVHVGSNLVVTIPDANLEAAVRQTLNLPAGTSICNTHMLLLTALTANNYNKRISNLEGLQYATNLTNLTVSWSSINDLTPLSNLTKLEVLFLYQNYLLSDISPLSGLTNLKSLNLFYTPITDIAALVNNPGLGSGDEIILGHNLLNLSGSPDPDLANIQTLQSRGVTVYY